MDAITPIIRHAQGIDTVARTASRVFDRVVTVIQNTGRQVYSAAEKAYNNPLAAFSRLETKILTCVGNLILAYDRPFMDVLEWAQTLGNSIAGSLGLKSRPSVEILLAGGTLLSGLLLAGIGGTSLAASFFAYCLLGAVGLSAPYGVYLTNQYLTKSEELITWAQLSENKQLLEDAARAYEQTAAGDLMPNARYMALPLGLGSTLLGSVFTVIPLAVQAGLAMGFVCSMPAINRLEKYILKQLADKLNAAAKNLFVASAPAASGRGASAGLDAL